jgi:hypothetical protein
MRWCFGRWSLVAARSGQSSNGIFVDGERVEIVLLADRVTAFSASTDREVTFEVEQPSAVVDTPAVSESVDEARLLADYAERYFASDAEDEQVGGRTMMIRKAFGEIQRQQKRRHRWIVAGVTLIAVAAGGYAYYNYQQLREQQELAEQIFYSMKAIDVNIADVERRIATSSGGQDQVRRYMEERRKFEANYEQFVAGLMDRNLSEQDRLILRVTRMLGECDLAAPPDYIREVHTYIRRWQSNRFVRAACARGHGLRAHRRRTAPGNAPQFFIQREMTSTVPAGRRRWGIARACGNSFPRLAAVRLKIGPCQGAGPGPDDERPIGKRHDPGAARASRRFAMM